MYDRFIYTLYRIYDMYTQDMKGGEYAMGCYGYAQCSQRSFLTRDEKVKMLQEYHDNLTQEAKGVAERIKELNARDDEE